MDCPRCSVELSPITRDESTIQRCAECGGLWVEVTDLNKMLIHGNLPALTAIGGFVNPDELTGMCPACSVELVVVESGDKQGMAYDTCESCGGIWVDGAAEEPAPEADWKAVDAEIVGFFRDFVKAAKKKK